MNRRARAVGIIGSAALFAASLLSTPAASAAAPGWPEGAPENGTPWEVCADEDAQYCIVEALLGDEPVGNGDQVNVSILDRGHDDAPASFNWAIQNPSGGPTWGLSSPGQNARITVRVGGFTPRYTSAYADTLDIETMTSNGNTTMTIKGKTAAVNWLADGCALGACGSSDEDGLIADQSGNVFSGNTQDMSGSGWDGARDIFAGMYIATNAQRFAPVVGYNTDPEPHWTFEVANPHFEVDQTTPASGSFTAYLPASYFTHSGVSPVTTEFEVTRNDDGTESVVSGSSTTVDELGGARLVVPRLGYSSPSLSVFSVPRTVEEEEPSVVDPPSPPVQQPAPVVASAVQNLRVAGKGKKPRTATWKAPSSNGGAAISAYHVEVTRTTKVGKKRKTATVANKATAALKLKFASAKAGKYTVRVSALNAAGVGPASTKSYTVRGK